MYCKVVKYNIYLQNYNTINLGIAMKKTVNVSLGGMVFCLEEDAFHRLNSYLKGLEQKFMHSSDMRDIMNDIEVRIAEHFKEKAPMPDMVISVLEVERVIGIMGNPSDFGEDRSESSTQQANYTRTHRRLFRDPINSVIGGVSSGLGYYWNIDPMLIRILFVILVIFGGGGVLIYVILWIVIPQANTVAERLEMTGDTVNAENIGKSFEEKRQ